MSPSLALLLLLLVYGPYLAPAFSPHLVRHPLPLGNHPTQQPDSSPSDTTSLLQTICGPDLSQISDEWYPDQRLDHFNGNNNATYGQHFLVNRRYYSVSARSDGRPVVFLLVGGESDMLMDAGSACWENITHVQSAKEEGALIVYLEHRFFGRNRGPG